MSRMIQRLLEINGIVQNVGFRYMVRQYALKHNLSGYVRNMSDKSVEILFQGSQVELDNLCDYLKLSPGSSKVKNIKIVNNDTDKSFDNFEIIV